MEGSYQGIDQAGLFWSMSVNQTGEFVSAFPVIHSLTVSLYVNGQEVDSRVIQRTARVDLVRENLTDPIVGVFLIPEEIKEPTPAIILLGGSEGRVQGGLGERDSLKDAHAHAGARLLRRTGVAADP